MSPLDFTNDLLGPGQLSQRQPQQRWCLSPQVRLSLPIPNGGTAPHSNVSVATPKGRTSMMNHWEFDGLVMTTYVAHDTTEPMSESANAATSELKEQSGHAKPHGGVVPRPNNSAVTLRGRTPTGNRCEFEGVVMIADMAHDTTGPASSAAPRATI